MTNFRVEIYNSINKINDNFENLLSQKEKNLLEKIKNTRIYCEEINDQLLKMIKRD